MGGCWKGIKAGKILPNIASYYRKKRPKRRVPKTAPPSPDVDEVQFVAAPPKIVPLVDLTSGYAMHSTMVLHPDQPWIPTASGKVSH
jgi:hypothetical protein